MLHSHKNHETSVVFLGLLDKTDKNLAKLAGVQRRSLLSTNIGMQTPKDLK